MHFLVRFWSYSWIWHLWIEILTEPLLCYIQIEGNVSAGNPGVRLTNFMYVYFSLSFGRLHQRLSTTRSSFSISDAIIAIQQ